jgi:hypothetical protein
VSMHLEQQLCWSYPPISVQGGSCAGATHPFLSKVEAVLEEERQQHFVPSMSVRQRSRQ